MRKLTDEKVGPDTSRATFSLGFAFLMMSLAGLAVPSFFLQGGYLLYGPLLVIFVLSVALIAQIRQVQTSLKDWTLNNAWKPIAVSVALLLAIIGFAPLSDIAYDLYAQEQLRALQLERIQDIPKDKNFLDAALALHQQMLGPAGNATFAATRS